MKSAADSSLPLAEEMAAAPADATQQSGWERAVAKFRGFFEERGLGTSDIREGGRAARLGSLPAAVTCLPSCCPSPLGPGSSGSYLSTLPVRTPLACAALAIVLRELIGLAMAATWCAGCYAVQPSKTMARGAATAAARSAHGAAMQRAYDSSMARATAAVQRLSWLSNAPGVDPGRLTVSLAESHCLRAAIKPVTFPFNLWAACKVCVWGGGMIGCACVSAVWGARPCLLPNLPPNLPNLCPAP